MNPHKPTIKQVSIFNGPAKDAEAWLYSTLRKLDSFDTRTDDECNLDNPIHALFNVRNWRDIDKTSYKKFKPALQLASLWLTDDDMLDWFYQGTTGFLQWQKVDGLKWPVLAYDKNITRNERNRETVRQLWLEKLKKLSKTVRFYVYHGNDELDMFGCTWSFASDLKRYRKDGSKHNADRIFQDNTGGWHSLDSRWPYHGNEVLEPAILVSDIYCTFIENLPQSSGR